MSTIAAWLFRLPGSVRDEAEALAHGSAWGAIGSALFVGALKMMGVI